MSKIFFGPYDITNRLITANEYAFAIPAYMPIVPGHTLVCPRRIVSTIEELNSEELSALFALVGDIKSALAKSFDAEGFNCAWNQGAMAGQTVDHLHIHVLARRTEDAGITEYEPRQFLYRPGVRGITPDEELEQVARKIAQHL